MFNKLKGLRAKMLVLFAVAMAAVQSHAYDISGLDSVSTVLTSVQTKAETSLVPCSRRLGGCVGGHCCCRLVRS